MRLRLGLPTEHPARAASRALALLSARQDTPRGAQEIELPTIVAPGGTMIQFVQHDQPVEADFVEQQAGSNPAGGLDVVDHVAMGLTLEQVDTWILFTRAVLALTASDSVDVAEPFGVMRGVGVANDTRSVRMLLNVSVVPSASPEPSFGSSPQRRGHQQHCARVPRYLRDRGAPARQRRVVRAHFRQLLRRSDRPRDA